MNCEKRIEPRLNIYHEVNQLDIKLTLSTRNKEMTSPQVVLCYCHCFIICSIFSKSFNLSLIDRKRTVT